MAQKGKGVVLVFKYIRLLNGAKNCFKLKV